MTEKEQLEHSLLENNTKKKTIKEELEVLHYTYLASKIIYIITIVLMTLSIVLTALFIVNIFTGTSLNILYSALMLMLTFCMYIVTEGARRAKNQIKEEIKEHKFSLITLEENYISLTYQLSKLKSN